MSNARVISWSPSRRMLTVLVTAILAAVSVFNLFPGPQLAAATLPGASSSPRAMDLYAPTAGPMLILSETTEPDVPKGGCASTGLYEPSLPEGVALGSSLPETGSSCMQCLYAPALPASILPPAPVRPTSFESKRVEMYAPSLENDPGTGAEDYGFAGLLEGGYWDDGIGGIRGRRHGRLRHAVYGVDGDMMSMLYDLAPQTEEEPPRELSKVLLPTYRIAPPDLLLIEAVKLVPRAPYRISAFDVLQITATGTLPDRPIMGYYLVEAEGIVTLGAGYQPVRLVGMTVEEAAAEITNQLKRILEKPNVSVQLTRLADVRQVSNMYPVEPDGTVNLLKYGRVPVAGKTMAEAAVAVEEHLAEFFDSPEITVDVMGYNSQFYYVVIAGAENGESIFRFPVTGNETVLDAIGNIAGLPQVSSKTMWVARPGPGAMTCQNILPVNYTAIARGGMTDTNYQLMPGDRLYIVDDKLIAGNVVIAQFADPIERMLKISQLGASNVRLMQIMGRGYRNR